jgi:hypothetical protein
VKKTAKLGCLLSAIVFLLSNNVIGQNPLITNQYSADPTARVFEDKIYVYPSHDILATPGKGRAGWFVMEDYHVFSSANLTTWTDHGMIVTQNKVPWVKPDSYSMWAPDCVYRNGKYYFYFPSTPKDTSYGRGFAIGVAVGDKPSGPFVTEPTPIKGVHGIDPNVLIDKDGQAYLYYSQGNIYVAKLKENMVELASEPKVIDNLPTQGLKEGPYVFERNGTYYLTYPHVANKTEQLEYATANNPMGPFKVTGVIMDESPECWTNHHSILPYKSQWYLFYHHNDLSPNFDKARSIRADSLSFNTDGTIKKVNPTLRGIGVTQANSNIQIDRYSAIDGKGASVDFLDTLDRFKGWKTIFNTNGGWVQYNTVDFGKKPLKVATIRALSEKGGTLLVHADNANGPVIAKINIPAGSNWQETKVPVAKSLSAIHHLYVVSAGNNPVEADWLRFE